MILREGSALAASLPFSTKALSGVERFLSFSPELTSAWLKMAEMRDFAPIVAAWGIWVLRDPPLDRTKPKAAYVLINAKIVVALASTVAFIEAYAPPGLMRCGDRREPNFHKPPQSDTSFSARPSSAIPTGISNARVAHSTARLQQAEADAVSAVPSQGSEGAGGDAQAGMVPELRLICASTEEG